MSSIRIVNIALLQLLWVIPVLAALYIYAGQRRRAALLAFVEAGMLEKISISISPVKRRWKAALLLLALLMVVLAAARPGWNPNPQTIQRRGRDVVFLIDVSKSMLAEDLRPSRIARAKLAILDCLDRLEGDRVALTVFAGTAAVKCPLTLDYGFFRMMLDDVTTDSIARGGTMIGDGIRKVLEDVFDDQERQFKDIILITDGEDHGSFPVEAARKAGERGIRILAIGLGDENEGKRVPVTDAQGNPDFLKYKGQEVWSKLDGDTLRKMVNATPGGKYLNVATGTIDLGDVYQKLIAAAEKRELEAQTIKLYEEKFQVFLSIAFGLLCIELLINERKKARNGS